jgi:hypothetical protein
LLRDLGGDWAARGCQVWWLDAADSQGRLRTWEDVWAESWGARAGANSGGGVLGGAANSSFDLSGSRAVLIDSGERMTWVGRLQLRWRLGRLPTLLTSHRERGERVLFRCRPQLAVFLALCDRLLGESNLAGAEGWDHETLARVFTERAGDLRASFFALYERAAESGR